MRIGVDLGGTKTEVIALDARGAVLMRERRSTPAGDYAAILDCIADLVADARARTGSAASIGIATPGALSRSGLLKNSNSTVLNGKPLQRDLSARLGQEVRLENDANCFALSEAVDGAASAHRVVFGVILGTGVGGGLVVNRRIVAGRNHIAGEWGHNPLPWMQPNEFPGARCYCGKRACIETFLAGPALLREFVSHGGDASSAEQIALAAERGDALARQCMASYVDRLARALASLINVVDPDAVVLGGGLSNIEALYREVPARLSCHAFSDGVDTPVWRARHGDSSGVRGAAWLWAERE
jgi:predicted NBD/HSP70 family sugar kinase